MELVIFGAIALAVIYVIYKAYGSKKVETTTVAEVAAKAEVVVAKEKPAKKPAAKKPAVKKATTRKPKAK
jgi:hypothetical protein